jgi:hypothetical protein
MEGVEPHSLDLNLLGFIAVCKAYPIGLCAAAIGYQNRHKRYNLRKFGAKVTKNQQKSKSFKRICRKLKKKH